MKSEGGGERGRAGERRREGEEWRTSCQVSPHSELSCESTITVSAAHNRRAFGERCCTRLQIKHYRAAIICRATLLRHFCCISTFSATKCSRRRGNCASGRMELLTIRFMSDPDPSPESRGLAVTSPSMLNQVWTSLMLSSLPALSLLLKLALSHPYVLSASASRQGNPQVESSVPKASFRISFASKLSGSAGASTMTRWNRSTEAFQKNQKL